MEVIYEKKKEMTFIGYHTEIRPEEAYQKCPEFWDKEYAAKSGAVESASVSINTVSDPAALQIVFPQGQQIDTTME